MRCESCAWSARRGSRANCGARPPQRRAILLRAPQKLLRIVFLGTVQKGPRLVILAEYSDRRLGFRAVESPAFCPRRSAAQKCRGQRRPGDRSRPWTGKADRSTRDFPSFRLRKEHYCRRWVDSRVSSKAEKAPAAEWVDSTALAQLGSRVLRQSRLKRQHSAFA